MPRSRCRIRVIDTFGTEPAYNHEEYATLHGYRTNWGYWNLNPKQFMTMFRECPSGRAWGRGKEGAGRGFGEALQKDSRLIIQHRQDPGLRPPGLEGSGAFQKERPNVDWVVEQQDRQAVLSEGNGCSGMDVVEWM